MSIVNEPGTVTEPALTFVIPSRTVSVSVTIPAQTITLPARSLVSNTSLDLAAVLALISPPAPPVVVPPPVVTPPPAPSTFWVYKDGLFNWGGDYSFSAVPNYKDAVGEIGASGGLDIAVTITGQWGGFLPYAGGTVPQWNFDDSPYNYLVLDFKPSIDNQSTEIYFVAVGDKPVGVAINLNTGKYGPVPKPGLWGSYKIPLADFGPGVAQSAIYKFAVHDQTGLVGQTQYLNNIGFTA